MPFTFPDPNTTPEFTADNGITYAWDVDDSKWQIRGFKAPAGRVAIFSPTEPLKHPDFNPPDDELIAGDTWYDNSDPDQLKEYVYDGTQWVSTGDYVKKKGGDSMQGPLQVTGNRDPNADGIESTVKTLNVDSGQSSSLNLKWKGATKVYVGEKNVSFIGDIKFNNSGKKIYTGSNDDKGLVINDNGVFYEGNYTVDKHVATKKNVDDAIALIGGDKEGLFTWDASSTDLPVGTWQFEGRSNPSYTEAGVQIVNIQKQDKNGLIFSEDDFKVGGQIEIKNVSNEQYLLGTITNIVDGGPKSIQITFNRDNASGQATGDQTIKTVKEPPPYVNKAGDTMNGDLKMKDNAQIQFIDPKGSVTLIRAGREEGEHPLLLDLRHPGGAVTGGYDIKVQGNSFYNNLRFTNAKGSVFEVNGGGGATVGSTFKMDVSLDNNRITKLGEAIADTDAVSLGQVTNKITANTSKNGDAIETTRDGLADLLAVEVLVATDDKSYLQPDLMEHAVACWPPSDHPLYHLIPQDYVLMTRMFEGAKKTEDNSGNIITDNKSLDSDNYGNDDKANVLIFHIPTGKIKDISTLISHNATAVDPDGNKKDKYPALRGHTVIPRDNGDVDIYSWIHNPRRNPNSQPGPGQPLYRIHIPANPNPADPFAGVTGQHTNIYCDPALLTTPDENPYDISSTNPTKDLKFQYEISQVAWDFIDSETGKRHHFLMSYNKGSRDYVTQRVFEINFDESNPDEGSIIPVSGHAQSTHESYASGFHVIKKDINDVYKCFLYGSPCGLTELYFVGGYYDRTPQIRNYGDYIPLGARQEDPNAVNGIGKPLIVGKGIVDNWYKSTTLAPQFLTLSPLDKDDYFSNIIIWYQSGYGVCQLNLQDLGTVDRSDEVQLNNNYQGTERELSSLSIETKEFYGSYLQDFSSRNLMRFNVKQLDTRSNGCLYFFDYKTDYPYESNSDGSIEGYNEEKTLYNSTRAGTEGNNGKDQDQILFKRPIIEVKPNYKTGRAEVHAIIIGEKHHPSGKEIGYHETFSGESVAKFGDVFVCSGAAQSHSAVVDTRIYVFDPNTRQIQRVCNEEVNTTSLIACPDHGVVFGASYGQDSQDNPTPVHIVSMLPGKNSGFVNSAAAEVPYILDAEGDPHYGDHRLEDVGHPVAATDAATKGYVDAIAGDNGGGAYLPLTGGTITGHLNVDGQLKVAGANEFKVENTDGTNFLRVRPDNGTCTVKGQMSVNSLFDVTADKVEYQKHATSVTQLSSQEIINAGTLDNLMRDPGEHGYLTGLATEEYVDKAIEESGGGSDLPAFKFTSKEIEDLQTGQFVCFDSSNNITTELGRIRAIAWKGTDVNGKRPMRDKDAITWDGNLNSTFSLLISSGTKTVLRTSMSQIINGHPTISYLAAFDVYCIQWTGGDTTVITSDFTRMTNSQVISFHCSELFF